ncbi:nucleotide exchange factor GrpE [Candidatus Sumerlaeota bacterium]|nr:nucleotide exchange factor GrpE [Candidatus Sumerlaeota bacterium]
MVDLSKTGEIEQSGQRDRPSSFRLKYRLRRAGYAERAERTEESAGVADPTVMRVMAEREQQIAKLATENTGLRDIALRARADLDNTHKRFQREKGETIKFATERLVRDLIPVLDNLERAIASAEGCADTKAICSGIQMVLDLFVGIMCRNGLEIVVADGQQFDPHFHEAVSTEEREDVADNQIVATLQKGYVLRGRVVRPAMVRVGRAVRRPIQAEEAVAAAPSQSGEAPASSADASTSIEPEKCEVRSDMGDSDDASQ